MRPIFALLPVMALLSACMEGPRGPSRSNQHFSARPEARQCLSQLGTTQADFTPLPDRFYGAGCSTRNTVRLASLRSDDGELGLSNLGPVACPLANTFAAWARYGVDRAAQQILGSALVRIETMGSYNCRNVSGSGKRSAHARAQRYRRVGIRSRRRAADHRAGRLDHRAARANANFCAWSTPAPASASARCWVRATTRRMPTISTWN